MGGGEGDPQSLILEGSHTTPIGQEEMKCLKLINEDEEEEDRTTVFSSSVMEIALPAHRPPVSAVEKKRISDHLIVMAMMIVLLLFVLVNTEIGADQAKSVCIQSFN